MLGLVILCASIVLAILLPAFGVDRLLLGGSLPEPTDAGSNAAQTPEQSSIHIWNLLGISGLAGLVMWFLGGTEATRTAKSNRRR